MRVTAKWLLRGLAGLWLAGQAHALDGQAFADRLAAVFIVQGSETVFGTATVEGDTITIDGVSGSMVGVLGPTPFRIDGDIVVSGVVETADGGFTADSVTLPDIDMDFDAGQRGRVSAIDIRWDGIYLPAAGNVTPETYSQLFRSMSCGRLSILVGDIEVLSIDSMRVDYSFSPHQGTDALESATGAFKVDNAAFDFSAEEPSLAAIAKTLGLLRPSGDISGVFDWSVAEGNMAVGIKVDATGIGALDMRAEVAGATLAALELVDRIETLPEDDLKSQTKLNQEFLDGLRLVGGSVRYDDASLTNRLLDFYAAQSGTDRTGFVESLKTVLPALMAEFGVADLGSTAVSAFLDTPQSLQVTIAPQSPTSFLALAMSAPDGLITALGLAVEANAAAAE